MTGTTAAPVEVFAHLASTQLEALSRLRAGDKGPCWIRALSQSAGQGRMGRSWQGIEGNLFASWYQVLPLDVRRVPQMAFVAGLAVHEALAGWVREAGLLRIKWPNDVLYDGAKLSGILVQSEPFASGLTGLAVGIGINVRAAPVLSDYAATALSQVGGEDVSADQVMDALNLSFMVRLNAWRTQGFSGLAAQWFALAYGREDICVVDGNPTGRMAGLREDGALLIRSADGTINAVSSGTVRYQEDICS